MSRYKALEYTMSDKARRELAPDHRAFQLAVALHANRILGIHDIIPISDSNWIKSPNDWIGIDKFEGGIIVGGKSIVIRNKVVDYDFDHQAQEPFIEAKATVQAIEAVNALRRDDQHYLDQYRYRPFRGDPLRRVFDGIEIERLGVF